MRRAVLSFLASSGTYMSREVTNSGFSSSRSPPPLTRPWLCVAKMNVYMDDCKDNIKPVVCIYPFFFLWRNGLQRVLRGKGGKRRTFRRRQDETVRDRQHRMGCVRRRRKIGRRPHEIRSTNRRRLVKSGTTEVKAAAPKKKQNNYIITFFLIILSVFFIFLIANFLKCLKTSRVVLDLRKWSVACTWARSCGWPLLTWPTRTNYSREGCPNKWRPKERLARHTYPTLKGECWIIV